MALTLTNLAASSSTSNGAGTASVSVPNNSAVYVAVGVAYANGTGNSAMTISGTLAGSLDGGVLTELVEVEDFGSRRTLWCYRGINTTGSTQSGTILFTAADPPNTGYQEHFWAVDKVEGIDTTTPNGTVGTTSGTGATSASVTVTGTPDSGDFVYAAFAHTGASAAMTLNGELDNTLSETGGGANFRRLLTAYDSAPDGSPTPGVSWSGAEDYAGIAFILNVGAGASPTTTNVTGSATAAVGIAETYTYTLDASPAGTVTVTPTAPVAGSWSPTTVGLTSGNWNTGLTSNFTASAAGSGNISSTNDGGLTNDTLAVTVYSTSRPSAVTAGSWTDEAGGSLVVADINDASDSTGAKDPAGASYPVLAFTATTPLTATSQTFYFRGRDIAAGKQARQVIYANDGTTVVATGAWKTMTGSLATYSDVLTPTATAYKGQIQTQALPTTPSHYSSATSGEWYALPNSSLTSSGVGWAGTDPGGTSDYQATVTAWGGACLNTVGCYYDGAFHAGIFIILFGGGHGDYAGNEVYSYGPINSESPGFKRLTDPTVPGVENTARDGSGNPVSRHTYDTLAYDAAANRMLCLGAPGYFSLGNAYNACDAFDFDTNTWSALADLTTGGGGTGSVSACTVIDGTYAWVWPMGNGQYLNRIALSGDARTTYAKDFPATRYGVKAGYDPVHEIMAWCSGSTVYAFDLRNPGSNVEYSPTTSGTAPTTGAPMAWDNANACFKVWADSGKTLFTLTPGANPYSGGDTWVWTSTTPAGGATPAAETTNGTHGRFQYNNSGDVIGALVMPNQTSSIYMFKP